MTHPMLSPAHRDPDVLILEGVLHGVQQEGARYGLTHPRRELLALVLETLLRSMHQGWEERLAEALTSLQTGRPSHPSRSDGGHTHLSDPAPRLAG